MLFLLKCRRTFLGIFAISCLTYLGYSKGLDVGTAIAGIVGCIAASNSAQKIGEQKYTKD